MAPGFQGWLNPEGRGGARAPLGNNGRKKSFRYFSVAGEGYTLVPTGARGGDVVEDDPIASDDALSPEGEPIEP